MKTPEEYAAERRALELDRLAVLAGFELHRQRGPHGKAYHPDVIGPQECDCFARARAAVLQHEAAAIAFLERVSIDPVGEAREA